MVKEIDTMMYPYMTLNDNTEIVHSEMLEDGRVKVYIEKPDEFPNTLPNTIILSPSAVSGG